MNRGDKEHDSELRRSLKVKGSPIQSALNDLARTQPLLTQRGSDLVAVQSPFQWVKLESKRLREMHTTAMFSGFVEIRR